MFQPRIADTTFNTNTQPVWQSVTYDAVSKRKCADNLDVCFIRIPVPRKAAKLKYHHPQLCWQHDLIKSINDNRMVRGIAEYNHKYKCYEWMKVQPGLTPYRAHAHNRY